MRFRLSYLLVPLFLLLASPAAAVEESGDTATYSQWIEEMKTRPRGPFRRIRWFCNDGSILEPEPYACSKRDGGIQHGEWTDHTKTIRDAGYLIANVLAEYSPRVKENPPLDADGLKQLLLEQFLIGFDDGWILRRARFYRGALQIESEHMGATALLKRFSQLATHKNQDYLLLREAFRLLPREQGGDAAQEVRESSTRISEKDLGFEKLRAKLHGQPRANDAQRIRRYAKKQGREELGAAYEELAQAVEMLFRPQPVADPIVALAKRVRDQGLKKRLINGAEVLENPIDDRERLAESSRLMAALRDGIYELRGETRKLQALELVQLLEQEVFTAGNSIIEWLDSASREERIAWMGEVIRALYGSGLMSAREWDAAKNSLERLQNPKLDPQSFRSELQYLNRVPGWAGRWLAFHFQSTIDRWAEIEPKTRQFIPDRLRGSPLLVFSAILDSLMRDSSGQVKTLSTLFGQPVGAGIRALNPGLARGVLHITDKIELPLDPEGIYLLPETITELTPVAGILTQGEGNTLSHVQLLASNLGIPNVVVDFNLMPQLKEYEGRRVVLAVSPGGTVRLEEDGTGWNSVFGRSDPDVGLLIKPDLKKLDLQHLRFLTLSQLRAKDAGRITGPKAANLGELKYHYPSTVEEGLVIPFGHFRDLLDQPMETGRRETIFEWMKRHYRQLELTEGADRTRATSNFLGLLRERIENVDPGEKFVDSLRRSLEMFFGPDGSYALFIRSDTNVEDLPGFTGAGLNLTVPNVVGFESILNAIQRVWASPFTERAFAWRQSHMESPEHVYPSVLLMKSVPVDKSGVMLTLDTENGDTDWLTIAVNHGIGGAVQGEAAEELRIHRPSGLLRVLVDATSPVKRELDEGGGLRKVQVSADGRVLTRREMGKLLKLARDLPERFPQYDDKGELTPADVEFGFRDGNLVLFQIRPFLRNRAARQNQYLIGLDNSGESSENSAVNLMETH